MTLARILCLAFLVACAPSTVTSGDDTDDPQDDLPVEPRYQALADQIEAERVMLGAPGVAALVMENGVVTFAKGFGLRNPDNPTAADAGTLFRIGSVTKMMTAAALLQLVANGQVGIDDPVTRAIPGFAIAEPANGASTITIRHLLSHASGLEDHPGADGPVADGDLSAYIMGPYRNAAYQMAPSGRFWNYSNPNFSLAGLVIELVTAVPYRRAMTERVFEPLGMTRTYWTGAEVIADGNYAHGQSYDETGKRIVQAPDAYDSAFGGPSGFAFASVWDLSKFVTLLLDGNADVLADSQRTAMQSPQISMEIYGDLMQYGYGLFVEDGAFFADGYRDVRIVSHGGDIDGFAADVFYVPSTKFAFVVLSNGDGAHFSRSAGLALRTLASLPAPTTGPDFSVDPSTFASLAGTYQDDFAVGRMIVSATASGVSISMPDLDAAGVTYMPQLEAWAPDNFTLMIDGFRDDITFIRDANGNPEYIRSRYYVGKRVATAALTARPTAIDAARLRSLLRRNDDRPSRHF